MFPEVEKKNKKKKKTATAIFLSLYFLFCCSRSRKEHNKNLLSFLLPFAPFHQPHKKKKKKVNFLENSVHTTPSISEGGGRETLTNCAKRKQKLISSPTHPISPTYPPAHGISHRGSHGENPKTTRKLCSLENGGKGERERGEGEGGKGVPFSFHVSYLYSCEERSKKMSPRLPTHQEWQHQGKK